MTVRDWPILVVSHQWLPDSDDATRLDEIVAQLEDVQDCSVIRSRSFDDAVDVVDSREDLGCVIVDWDLAGAPQDIGFAMGFDADGKPLSASLANPSGRDGRGGRHETGPEEFVRFVRERNRAIHILLLTDHTELSGIPTSVIEAVNGCLWKTVDTPDFVAGRIATHVSEYMDTVEPPFFQALVDYAERYKYAWHTPGHSGGQGFMRSPAGVAFHDYFGENVFRSDLSISVPELGSLLDHSGVTGEAERNSARVFGADLTFYVLNGTSTANQIIWRSQVLPGELALMDRNCHKSLNYAMVITEAYPTYLVPRRNALGIIGPVRLAEFTEANARAKVAANPLVDASRQGEPLRMSALTNSTYDGLCYNVQKIKAELNHTVENIHFDEAWFAYARFHPIYAGHFGMADVPVAPEDKPIFCSQSTHKLLTAFSQASMLHVRHGGSRTIDPAQMNESYMMHASTSPQYTMIASLEVASKMMADNGEAMLEDIIVEAIRLRQRTARMRRELANRGTWFFDLWQPARVPYKGRLVDFCDVPVDHLAHAQEAWTLAADNPWHGFADIEDDYVMLDPIKLTFRCPGVGDDGSLEASGIPAPVVTNYLIGHNIVCEKTDYYSFLMLNSLGTTRAKQGTLLTALMKFKEDYDRNRPLAEIFPKLVRAHPERYGAPGYGLRDHCDEIHGFWREHQMLRALDAAFETIPRPVLTPAAAYHEVVRGNVEYVWWDEMEGHVPAVMVVPYPPGIPIAMGGEMLDEGAAAIRDYLCLRERFEQEFPGYESDIHGVERSPRDGTTCFRTLCVKR